MNNVNEFRTWLTTASPEDQIVAAKQVLSRIATLDQTYRDKFTTEIESDPQVSRLFKQHTV